MYNLRNELIKTIIKSLKIDDNPFNVITIQDMIENISDDNLQEYYQALFGNEHSYLNGLDRVAKVAEQFKPQQKTDLTEIKAKELIEFVHSMNHTIFENAKMSGRTFEDELKGTKFLGLRDKDKAILNQVKPYCEYKQLISNISRYSTSLEQLNAFKNAIEYSNSYSGAIECNKVKKLLK